MGVNAVLDLKANPISLPQVIRQDVGVVLATVLPRVDLRAVALFQFVLKLLPSRGSQPNSAPMAQLNCSTSTFGAGVIQPQPQEVILGW